MNASSFFDSKKEVIASFIKRLIEKNRRTFFIAIIASVEIDFLDLFLRKNKVLNETFGLVQRRLITEFGKNNILKIVDGYFLIGVELDTESFDASILDYLFSKIDWSQHYGGARITPTITAQSISRIINLNINNKNRRSNQYHKWEKSWRGRITFDFSKLVSEKNISLAYQPQFDLRKDKIVGAEALLRISFSRLGEVNTQKFIAFAEKGDLLDLIFYWSIETSCKDLSEIRKRGVPLPKVSLNSTPLQLTNNLLVLFIQSSIERYNLKGQDLIIEILEGRDSAPIISCIENLNRIRNLGITFSLDDFSISSPHALQLLNLPISQIKIDKTVVDILKGFDNIDFDFSDFFESLESSRGMTFIAEGVETKKQAELLLKLGVRFAQGFYFSPPLTVDGFVSFYELFLARNLKNQY
ncbi:TPA: EAL domain-containing protein [Pseudomonas aeruginosa]|nr:EAL domain-containing protein [Pseudomonas aeruginosa]